MPQSYFVTADYIPHDLDVLPLYHQAITEALSYHPEATMPPSKWSNASASNSAASKTATRPSRLRH